MSPFDASFTCDLEPDCPPFLHGFRGIETGLPKLLSLLGERSVRGPSSPPVRSRDGIRPQ